MTNAEELCPTCKPHGKCLFKEEVVRVGKDTQEGKINAEDALNTLSVYRKMAKKLKCPIEKSTDQNLQKKLLKQSQGHKT